MEKALIITRMFDAPAETLFRYWTDPEYFKRWWGPKGYMCSYARMDLRAGGRYLVSMRSPEGQDYWSTGTYLEIDPPRKLVFTDSFSDDRGNIIPAATLGMSGDWPLELSVTVSLESRGDKTEMTLVQEGIPEQALLESRAGWQESFDKIEEEISRFNSLLT